MGPVYVFEEMRLPMELLAATLIYLFPFGERRERFWLRAVGGYVLLTLFALLYFPIFLDKEAPRLAFLSVFWYSLIALTAVGYGKYCFRITWCDALFFGIAAFLTQNIVYCIYHCFIARVLIPVLRLALPLYIFGALLVCAVVYVPVCLVFQKPLRNCRGLLLEDNRFNMLELGGVFLVMMICLFFYQGAFDRRVSLFDTLAWLSGVVICLFMLLILYSILQGVVRMRENTLLENMLRSSEHYYELSKEHIAIINRKCHDLKHQLKALATADESQRAEYIEEAQKSIIFYQHLIYTDNEALNTILAEKGLFCQEKDIDFQCAVDDVDLSFIALPDLYAILGNAIDNAIEYVETQLDRNMRTISLRITKNHQFVGIQITNPYAGAALPSGELPKSKKADPYNHGFGLQSIRYLAEKYGGTMEFSTHSGLFALQIMLPYRGS
ncbi:MAG: sensor histidine kinase [Oscillospiraceae bacterium]|nr:sensor histidine kinase [Oscillospiraceae bacterium]